MSPAIVQNALAQIRQRAAKRPQFSTSRWPEPEKSIGNLEAKVGDLSCWKVKGPAREAWEKIYPRIKEHLDANTEPPDTTSVVWIIRMTGYTPETAAPTIIFCCEEKVHRKIAKNAIKNSDILNDYDGIQLADRARVPGTKIALVAMSGNESHTIDFGNVEYDAVSENTSVHSMSGAIGLRNSNSVLYPAKEEYKALVYSRSRELRSGSSLMIRKPSQQCSDRTTTIGGSVRINGITCLMTAAHPFAEQTLPPPISRESSLELSFSDSDEESELINTLNVTRPDCHPRRESRRSIPEYLQRIQEYHDDIRRDHHPSRMTQSAFGQVPAPRRSVQQLGGYDNAVGRLLFSSIVDSKPELDYALLFFDTKFEGIRTLESTAKIKVGLIECPTFIRKDELRCSETTDVSAYIASAGFVSGVIDTTAAFIRPPHALQYQEVYSVKFETALALGDCGSWVEDTASQGLYGHIVAGSPEDGLAYVVPAYQIFEDLSEFFSHGRQEMYLHPTNIDLIGIGAQFDSSSLES